MLKANGLLNTEDREEEIKQMEVYKNHSKFMKTKVGGAAACTVISKVSPWQETQRRRNRLIKIASEAAGFILCV